jgi:hypothetical protein
MSFPGMGRFNRVVAIDVPHHVTQRGNGRRFVLEAEADRTVYLQLLHEKPPKALGAYPKFEPDF